MLNRRKKATIVAVAVAMVGAGSVAALWSASGTGSGQTSALTAQTITVAAATGASDLYPGFTGGDVFFTLDNTNPYPVTFASMTTGTVTSSNQTACPSSNVTVAGATGLSLVAAAGATTSTQSIANVVSMAAGAPDGCQGVTFTVALTLSGIQS